MAQFIATLTDHFEDNSLVDGNFRIVISNGVVLALWQDKYGSIQDARWTEATWPGFAIGGTFTESGGLLSYVNTAPLRAK